MDERDVIFTRHAKARMKERGISQKEVISAMDRPDNVLIGKKGELNALKTVAGGKRIRVIYADEASQRVVITAMILD